jgi:hypothetical protein
VNLERPAARDLPYEPNRGWWYVWVSVLLWLGICSNILDIYGDSTNRALDRRLDVLEAERAAAQDRNIDDLESVP